jgi:UDP-N-acetylmuramoyl-tripeptide--D-alanyl-D-alanine ligase
MFLSDSDPQFKAIQTQFDASTGVTTDTRAAGQGQLFFALRGENFNGNAYATQAIEAGCIAAVVDESENVPPGGDPRFILVPDALTALQSLARWHRRRWSCPVIGLTGSNGKTTTKELMKCVLETAHSHVHATIGNFNNHIGVPLTLLAARTEPDIAIIEMGANAQQEIALLAQIAEPNAAVITNIGRAHLEGFGGEEGVMKGKGELFDFIRNEKPECPVFANGNHPKLMKLSEGLNRHEYGTSSAAPFVSEVHAEDAFTWVGPSGAPHGPLKVHVQGEHNRENIMTATAIGLHFGVTESACSHAVESYEPNNNRSQWTTTPRNRILLDAYNANPSSMRAALTSFKRMVDETPGAGTPLCILGDMAELGKHTAAAHEEILTFALELGLQTWAVGPEFNQAAKAHANMLAFASTEAAAAHCQVTALTGHRILLKGSRSIALEALVEVL